MLAAAGARWEFTAIGTVWQIETERPLSADLRGAVGELIDEFDREWSRFRSDSLIARLAAGGAAEPAPRDASEMLDLYVALDAATAGAVNPLIGDALARRGYDPQYGFVDHGAAASPPGWREILTWTSESIQLSQPATIDIGAVGKGRLVDLVMAEVASQVDGGVVVDASGDLAVRGRHERIGLEHPFDARRAIGVWELHDGALCASAINRRAWGDGLHHVLDARTGEPVRTMAATWAVSGDALTADAVATALFFEGGPQFAHDRGAAWVRMTTDGRVERSPDCEAELFT